MKIWRNYFQVPFPLREILCWQHWWAHWSTSSVSDMNNAKHFDAGGELSSGTAIIADCGAINCVASSWRVLQAFRSTFQGGDSVQRLVILFDHYLSVVLSNISRRQAFRQSLEENIDNIQRLVQAIVHIPQIWVRCYQLSLVLPTSAELAFRSRFKRKHTSAKSLFNFVVNWYIIECS